MLWKQVSVATYKGVLEISYSVCLDFKYLQRQEHKNSILGLEYLRCPFPEENVKYMSNLDLVNRCKRAIGDRCCSHNLMPLTLCVKQITSSLFQYFFFLSLSSHNRSLHTTSGTKCTQPLLTRRRKASCDDSYRCIQELQLKQPR